MISAIIIAISGVLSVFSFIKLIGKKDNIDNKRKEAASEEERKRREHYEQASKFGAAAGVAGVAAGTYLLVKNHQKPDHPIRKKIAPSHLNPIRRRKRKKLMDRLKFWKK